MAVRTVLEFPKPSLQDWQTAYQSVLNETDNIALFKCVEVAQAALLLRRDDLATSSEHLAERQAVEDALNHLRYLKKERLNFRE